MTGILLINLGTPDSPSVADVRKYLKQFLSDPLVIDINPVARKLLVNAFIVPFRSPKSAEAYKKIWTDRGSPLLFNTLDLVQKVQTQLGDNYAVEVGMRYGSPSLEQAIYKLISKGIDRLIVFPLYPQYASSSTESSLRAIFEIVGRIKKVPPIKAVPPFFNHPAFINAFALQGAELLKNFKPDFLLFSYHGLPERQITCLDKSQSHCLKKSDCCNQITEHNQACYRAHCFATTQLLTQALEQQEIKVPSQMSFQSRLGRTPWIKPYTDLVIPELAQKGIKRLAIYSPAFVADCLETLEELNIRARELFLQNGGEDFLMIPSLNASAPWVDAVCEMIEAIK